MKLKKYESEITQFIRQLHEKNPQLAAEQQQARAIWWEKTPVTPAEQQKIDESDLPKPAYAYFGDAVK
ncbi:MAG: DUF3460 family protein [Burkholderiales bacterium]